MGEAKELIKHCIQLPHDKGYKYAKSLLEKTYGNSHKILSLYRKEVKDWPKVKFADAKPFFVSSLTLISSVRVYQIINTAVHLALLKYYVC